MKRFLPFIILFFIILLWWFIAPGTYKVFIIIFILIELIGIPLAVLSMQRKDTQLAGTIGLIIGAVVGFFLGAKVVDVIGTMIYGDMSKFSIRIDSLCGALLGASILSSIGAVVGGRISKHRKEKK